MATIRKLRGRWQAQVRRRGMAPRAKNFDQKAVSEKWARSLESKLDRCGMLPDTRVAETTTLRSILERYMTEISPRKRSAHTEISRIKALLRRPLCHRTLALLSTSDLATYRDERLRSVSPSTVIRELNTISHAIDTAMRDWDVYLHRNPCKLVRRPSLPRGRNRRLRDDEEQRLLDAADSGRNIYMRDLIVLAIETGMRRGELLSLDWQHVDLETQIAHLPMTKNGESRDVPLSSRAREPLLNLRRRMLEHEAQAVLGRRSPITDKASAFGARHYQPHITALRPGTVSDPDLSKLGKLVRENIASIEFDRLVIRFTPSQS